jgi:hypothetical protein
MKLSFKPVQDHAIGLEEIVEHDALDEFPEMPKHIKDGFISAKAFHDSGEDTFGRYEDFLADVFFDVEKQEWVRMYIY